MLHLDDLTNIPIGTRQQIQNILELLLSTRRITGYNWYDSAFSTDSSISISHMQEDDDYKSAMITDLDSLSQYPKSVEEHIRSRGTAYFPHQPNFVVTHGLRLKRASSGAYLDLESFPIGSTLEGTHEFGALENCLIGEQSMGWEINMPFYEKTGLFSLLDLIVEKSVLDNENCWPMAHRIPVILIGKEAFRYLPELEFFSRATKVVYTQANNEVSFVTGRNIDNLRGTQEFSKLLNIGFKEEPCLANKLFINKFVDENENY